jgi:multidrug efflux pump subunit AcrB
MHSDNTNTEGDVRGVAAFSVGNPHLMIVICIIIVLLGAIGITSMPKDLLPSSNQPAVQILSIYPGMATLNVETDLTWKFERYTGQAVGLSHQESRSMPGISVVKNFFDPKAADQNSAMSQTTALIMSVLRRLPPGAQPPIVLPFDPMANVPLALVAVTGDFPPNILYDYAQYDVRREIQSNPGAIAPTVMGGAEKQIIIELDPAKLKQYNLSPLEVINKLSHLNTFIPTGDVKIGKYDYQVLSNGLAATVKDLDSFPVRTQEGVEIFLNQVGQAKEGNIIQTNVVTIDGKEQVYVPVFRQQGANSLGVVDTVREGIKFLEKSISGLKLSMVSDQTVYIRHAIQSIAEEALIGGGLAAMMVFLFLGNPRATFATLLSLPLSTFFVGMGLKAAGQTINVMTLGGIALSIGLLVDNSIVAIENIMRHLHECKSTKRKDRIKVVIQAAQEVTMPIVASTLCNLIVLSPVILLGGVVQILFAAVAKTVMFAIIGSLIAETAVIPLFASKFLTGPIPELPAFFKWINRGVHRLTEVYGRALAQVMIRFKYVVVFVVLLLALGGSLITRIGTELFPRADSGGMVVELRFPSGLRVEETTKRVGEIEKQIREWIPKDDLHMMIANIGVYNGFPAAFTTNAGTQDAFLIVELTEERKETSQAYAKILRERIPKLYPDVEMGIQLGGLLSSALNSGLKAPIDIQFSGPKIEKSFAMAKSLVAQFKSIPGAVDVRIQERLDAPEIDLQIHRTASDKIGLFTDEIVENIVSALNGSIVFKPAIWVDPSNGIDYFMGVRFPESKMNSLDDLKSIPITGRNQIRPIPLKDVADVALNHSAITELNRVDMKRVVNVYMDAQGRDIGGVARDAEKILKSATFPDLYTASIQGEVAEMKEAIGSLSGGFLLSALLVYLVLVVQFRSFVYPGIMMMTVPLGMVGIVLMFVLTNTYFSLQAAIGTIFMVGIAVSNGVLLVEFIQHKMHKDHLALDKAILAGCTARLRPIMMTSMASILGLMPMALGLSKGSEANVPLGRAVIGGQMLSTVLTLFIVPTLFRFVHLHVTQRMTQVEEA